MTIKEVEMLTGMTRANIRFYESEGLLVPARSANGYREYSEKDVEILKKIKLLRMLHISLDEIKALKSEETDLLKTLSSQLEKLEREKGELEKVQGICRLMQKNEVKFKSLNAEYYLKELERSHTEMSAELKMDELPKVIMPIRRFFARTLDLFLYSVIWGIILMFVFRVNVANRNLFYQMLDTWIGFGIMIICESFLLSRVGTTLGKWILGIRITNIDDGKLTFREAFQRTLDVVRYGYGFGVPFYEEYRAWKCYKAHANGEVLEWEAKSNITLQDEKRWRNVIYVVTSGIIFAVVYLATGISALPDNRGEISVKEFAENYNQLAEYYDVFTNIYMNENGQWEYQNESSEEEGVFVIDLSSDDFYPEIHYVEENGVMKEMSFSSTEWVIFYQDELVLAMKAFVNARSPKMVFSDELIEISEEINACQMGELTFELDGVDVIYVGESDQFTFTMRTVE